MPADCVFAYDDYFCRDCVTSDVPPDEIIPVQLFDVLAVYPTCVACGKVHTYMVLEDELDPVVRALRPKKSETNALLTVGQLQAMARLEETIRQLAVLMERNIAALERQTEVLSRPDVL